MFRVLPEPEEVGFFSSRRAVALAVATSSHSKVMHERINMIGMIWFVSKLCGCALCRLRGLCVFVAGLTLSGCEVCGCDCDTFHLAVPLSSFLVAQNHDMKPLHVTLSTYATFK